ncbi:hypothetical protein [Clostridium cellulovorans]|uniref:Restriction endonuclease type IV Mrr domain-containing protein n=1 Tax=Clostridium cellulovorans (strain ATCC 35296 / DSM 3052 / OCM 3 / 743B) TaxID=573061 RepID=D9SSM5_CLOC7|nr:hypothetical protein [Clostridium cellulovorans]ADL50622.1 hypothetical protein Clocel_0852 [Clostridium cellulovorans 743B]
MAYLNTLNEHKMAKDIFVPILKKMDLKGVKFTGGSDEQGIDIEYYELSKPERFKQYVGIQFKKGDITYSARGTNNSIKEIKNQAEEAFQKEICSVNSGEVNYISRLIVATTGEINENARKLINKAKVKGENTRITYWDQERLAEYINEHWIDEFINYFGIKLEEQQNEEENNDEDEYIVNENYLNENYEKEVKKCRKVKKTMNSWQWEIIEAMINNIFDTDYSSISMSDLLMELESTEDNIRNELLNLVQLKYISLDEGEIYFDGNASDLSKLAHIIIDEMVGAEEFEGNEEYAKSLFFEIIK